MPEIAKEEVKGFVKDIFKLDVRYWRSVDMRWQLLGWSTSSPALLVLALEEPVRQSSAWRFSLTAEHIIHTEES